MQFGPLPSRSEAEELLDHLRKAEGDVCRLLATVLNGQLAAHPLPPDVWQGAVGFSERLRAARRARGLSQVQLSLRAGLHAGKVSQLEHRELVHPRVETVAKLAVALGCKLDDLVPTEEARRQAG